MTRCILNSILTALLTSQMAFAASPFVDVTQVYNRFTQQQNAETIVNQCQDASSKYEQAQKTLNPGLKSAQLHQVYEEALLVCEYGQQNYNDATCQNAGSSCKAVQLKPVSEEDLPGHSTSVTSQNNNNIY